MRDAPIVRRVLLLAAALVVVAACGTDPRADRLASEISDAAGGIMIFHEGPHLRRDTLGITGDTLWLSDGFRGIGPEPSGFSRTAAERVAFLCETVAPMVKAAGLDGLEVAWESGERLSDCPAS